jgi:tetratricopeptide (TPR) repeat protein
MLLRSASSPLLNAARAPAAAAEHANLVMVPAASPARHRQGSLCRALSEADLLASVPIPAARTSSAPAVFVEEDEDALQEDDEDVFRRLLTSAGLDLDAAAAGREEAALSLLEGVGGGGGRGKACRGGRGGDGDGNDGRGAADAHYRRMIRANPGNSLPLGNYARYLKEVEGDAARAQEYCERAIVANPADGDALALYAGLVWETSRDAQRADAYYSRAVQAAPDDW